MTWRHYLLLFVVGLLVPFGISRFQSQPGYMDADYYFVGGIQLAEGKGFTEPYLWNYLDNPTGLPHPSHTYWMPLASIVSAISEALRKKESESNAGCLSTSISVAGGRRHKSPSPYAASTGAPLDRFSCGSR